MKPLAPLKVTILHNLPAPYRLTIFDRLLDDPELDVAIFFTGRPKSNRPSMPTEYRKGDRRVEYLSGFGIPFKGGSADRININTGLNKILDSDPDVIVLYSYQDPTNMMTALLCRLRRIPYIVCAEVSYVWNRSAMAKASAPLIRTMLRGASVLVAGSRSCAQYFASQGVDESRIVIVPTFSQFNEISSILDTVADDKEPLRQKLDLQDKFVVTFVGRLVDYKGVQELFSAMDTVWESKDDAVLVIVGTGPMSELVSDKKKTHPGKVIHLENLDYSTLVRLYATSDVHVLPSWHEAYGLVCGEALASGTPSIVTRVSGCSDLVVDGVNGYLVESRDPDSLSSAILRLAADSKLAENMKRSARASVEHLTEDRAALLLKEAFRKAAGQ